MTFNREALADLQRRHPHHCLEKYYNWFEHRAAGSGHCERLGLNDSHPLRILDIGAGFGYFAAAAVMRGHAVVALQPFIDSATVIQEVVKLNTAPIWIHHAILPMERPPIISHYDLITAMGLVPFNNAAGRWWNMDEYRFLFRCLLEHLTPGGRINWLFNRGPQWDTIKAVDWGELDGVESATIDDNILELKSESRGSASR